MNSVYFIFGLNQSLNFFIGAKFALGLTGIIISSININAKRNITSSFSLIVSVLLCTSALIAISTKLVPKSFLTAIGENSKFNHQLYLMLGYVLKALCLYHKDEK